MIRTSIEGARGCGVRKPGGLYLVAPSLSEPCSRLPVALDRCPHCGGGIGPARGWTWITPSVIVPAKEHSPLNHNVHCPLGAPASTYPGAERFGPDDHRMGERAGLIWVGEKFYKTPEAFMAEAATMGVSRRVSALPRNFKLGETWVLLGHRKAIRVIDATSVESISSTDEGLQLSGVVDAYHWQSGIITVFRPRAVEYIVKGDETDEEIEALEKRGISPVKVVNPMSDGVTTTVVSTGELAPV